MRQHAEQTGVKTGGFPTELRTERLLLRRFAQGDFDDFFSYVSRPDVARYTSFEPRTREEAQTELAKRLADPPMDEPGQFISRALTSGPGHRIMGEVMLFQRDVKARQGEIGYMLHPDFYGRGFALEAARVMLGQGFEALGWHRIYARLSDANTPSVRLLEKLGMRREAHFREHEIFKGEWDNQLIYAMLEDEWRAGTTR